MAKVIAHREPFVPTAKYKKMTSKLNIQKITTKSVSRLDKWSTIVNYDSKVILVQFQFRIVKKPNSVT